VPKKTALDRGGGGGGGGEGVKAKRSVGGCPLTRGSPEFKRTRRKRVEDRKNEEKVIQSKKKKKCSEGKRKEHRGMDWTGGGGGCWGKWVGLYL